MGKLSRSVLFVGRLVSAAPRRLIVRPLVERSFCRCGKGFHLGKRSDLRGIENISVGNHVSFGPDMRIWTTGARVIIGDDVMFGPHVTIISGDHRIDVKGKPMREVTQDEKLPENDQDIVIGDDVWVGANATILKGAHIPRGSVIAAGALVNKELSEQNCIWGGGCLPDCWAVDFLFKSMKKNLAVTMFGVDPSCLGGISTLARMLCEELPKASGVDFEYIPTVNQGTGWEKVRVFKHALTLANWRFSQVRGVVHIHMADNTSIIRSAVVSGIAKRNGQAVVLQIHCDLYRIRNASTAAMQKLIDGVIRQADHIIALGSYLVPLFKMLDYPLSQVTSLSNPVPCPEKNGYSTFRSKILFLGNVSKDKGVPELLEAVAQIDSMLDSEIKIEICGKDHMNVKEAIERHGLGHRVIYRGIVAPDQTFFSKYLLNILPSHKEAMPFALLEASANGVPSIATRVGSIPEIIEDGVSGFLVEPNDSFALAQRIMSAVSDRGRLMKMSNEIYSTIRSQYAMEPYMEKLLAIYDELSV